MTSDGTGDRRTDAAACQLSLTVDLLRARRWPVVLLRAREKRPVGPEWLVTRDLSRVLQHLHEGGNLGLVCGEDSGVAVLDLDDLGAAGLLEVELGSIGTTVLTGSGKRHVYVAWEPGLPARLYRGAVLVGEVQRGPRQQVVMPPSVHPITGRVYEWRDAEVRPLTDAWRAHLLRDAVPSSALGRGVPEEYPWEGPEPEAIVAAAMRQPGARRRRGGSVKFQCPGCRAEGHDRHRDNAIVRADGRWGCALDPGHRRAIGVELGVLWSDEDRRMAEELVDDDVVRKILHE